MRCYFFFPVLAALSVISTSRLQNLEPEAKQPAAAGTVLGDPAGQSDHVALYWPNTNHY